MRLLVTGAGGFIGHKVCLQALNRGDEVFALYHRDQSRLAGLSSLSALHIFQGDLLDCDKLSTLMADGSIEGICHLAVVPPGGDVEWGQRVNVEGTRTVVQAAELAGVERLVYTSSMSVYDFMQPCYLPVDEKHPTGPLQAYGEEKLAAEEICLPLGKIKSAVLRLAGVYGADRRAGAVYNFARAMVSKKPVHIAVDRAVDLLYVDDAAGAVLDALHSEACGLFNIGAGEAVQLSELAAEIADLLEQRAEISSEKKGAAFYMGIGKAQREWGYCPLPRSSALRSYLAWIKRGEGEYER